LRLSALRPPHASTSGGKTPAPRITSLARIKPGLSGFIRKSNNLAEEESRMSEIESTPEISTEQKDTIVRASDAFGFWSGCAGAACRRARRCCAFAAQPVPHSAVPLVKNLGPAFRAVAALVPRFRMKRNTHAEMNRRMSDIMLRATMQLEREMDRIEEKAGMNKGG
jgi:hypothetical protein